MAKVLSSISGNLISAASAGYAPTNSADVSAIASAYQVVSATGTQLYAGTAHVTSINSAPLSASRAGNAANASLANSAYYDGTGRLISSLPDSAAVSSIASSYAPTFGLNAGKISSINGSALDTPTGGGVVTATGSGWIAGEIRISSINGSGMYAQSAGSARCDEYGNNIQNTYVPKSQYSSLASTVTTNSAAWGVTVSSPSGTILVNNGEIEGTNSAVLTASAAPGFTATGNLFTPRIETYLQKIVDTALPGEGATLHLNSDSEIWNATIIVSGQTVPLGVWESASAIASGNTRDIYIPLGDIRENIYASADGYISLYGNRIYTAEKTGGLYVTGVAELAWKSAVDDVTNTVSSNSATWGGGGGGGVDSATVSAIASSYAESAVSGVEGTVSSNSASWGAGASLPISGKSGYDSAYYGYQGVDVSGIDITASVASRTRYGASGVSALDLTNFRSGFLTPSSLELKDENGVTSRLTRRSLTFSTQTGSSVVNASSIDLWNTISSLPGSSEVSAIASSYAESAVSSKADSSALSSYALSADVSGTVDLVSTQSANWGGSALALSAGPGISLTMVGNTLVISTAGV